MTTRCDLSDLPADQCACRIHGPAEERPETVGQAFEAQFPGRCGSCDGRIVEGQKITRLADPGAGYAHVDPEDCR